MKLAKAADLDKYPLPKRLRDKKGRDRQIDQLKLCAGSTSARQQSSSSTSTSFNSIVSGVANLTTNQKKALMRKLNTGGPAPSSTQQQRDRGKRGSGNQDRGAASTNQPRGNASSTADYYANMTCYNCGQKGHPSRLCPLPPTPETQRRRNAEANGASAGSAPAAAGGASGSM